MYKYIISPVLSGLGVVLLCSVTRTPYYRFDFAGMRITTREKGMGDRLWQTEVPGSHGSCTMVETERDKVTIVIVVDINIKTYFGLWTRTSSIDRSTNSETSKTSVDSSG